MAGRVEDIGNRTAAAEMAEPMENPCQAVREAEGHPGLSGTSFLTLFCRRLFLSSYSYTISVYSCSRQNYLLM